MLSKSPLCTKKIHTGQSVLHCIKCSSCPQTHCFKLSKSQTLLYLNSNEEYLYKICLAKALPFQKLHDDEFINMFQHHYNMGVSTLITDCLNREPSLDILIKIKCKYRSVKWYKNSLANSKKQNLSILYFNVRSIVKNKHLLEEFLHDIDQCPSILAVSETISLMITK